LILEYSLYCFLLSGVILLEHDVSP
jgi:hypothetical protein